MARPTAAIRRAKAVVAFGTISPALVRASKTGWARRTSTSLMPLSLHPQAIPVVMFLRVRHRAVVHHRQRFWRDWLRRQFSVDRRRGRRNALGRQQRWSTLRRRGAGAECPGPATTQAGLTAKAVERQRQSTWATARPASLPRIQRSRRRRLAPRLHSSPANPRAHPSPWCCGLTHPRATRVDGAVAGLHSPLRLISAAGGLRLQRPRLRPRAALRCKGPWRKPR